MFIGHFAVALAAKKATPRVSLAVLFAAAQLADLLWPLLVALGIEQVAIDVGNTAFTPLAFVSYPYSHSLALLIVWGVVLGGMYRAVAGGRRTFVTLAALVMSHWVLDYITHRPDMPLYPNGPKVGLGLWNSIPGTLAVELTMFGSGAWVYLQLTRATDRLGRWGLIALLAFMLATYLSNLANGEPPSVTAIWILGTIGGLLILGWAWVVDQHRSPVG